MAIAAAYIKSRAVVAQSAATFYFDDWRQLYNFKLNKQSYD